MKRNRILLVVALVLIYWWFFTGNDDSSLNKAYAPAIFIYFCQYLEELVIGNEAKVPKADYKLKGLAIAFRHGERSPLIENGVLPDCTAYHDVDRRSFSDYESLTEQVEFTQFLQVDPYFKKVELAPQRSKCSIGNLTAEGALQLVKLGDFLRTQYVESGVLDASTVVDFQVSPYRRTFQSAVAFASSFFFPLRQLYPEIILQAAKTTYFCNEDNCTCPQIEGLRKVFHQERSAIYIRRYPDLSTELQAFAKASKMAPFKHPLEFIDVVLGQYACRRQPLPCFEGKCISTEGIAEASEAVSSLVREVFSLSKPLRTLYAVESYPILNSVANTIAEIRKDRTSKRVNIFSGHDITLMPLEFTLGLNITAFPPPYASRLVFEVYEKTDQTTSDVDWLFLRVLYNGVDHTTNLSFCKTFVDGLCPANAFEKFARSEMLPTFSGEASVSAICEREKRSNI
uniref:2-phosphoxylose phosphatase 1 n=1 Tax=Panagrellus redivivus TaxID=6233 RepID=A0A7E4VA02_PANRE